MLVVLAGNSLVIPLSGVLAVLWARRSHTPWAAIGYVRPRSWLTSMSAAALLGIAFKIAMKAVVMPLLGADPVNHAYHYLAGNGAALPGALYAIILGAGFGEETIFRGYLFERLGKLIASRAMVVVLSALWFGAVHYPDQGLAGAEQAAIVGLVFGVVYLRTKTILPLMMAHVAFDLTALAMIYWNLEANVAHLVFPR